MFRKKKKPPSQSSPADAQAAMVQAFADELQACVSPQGLRSLVMQIGEPEARAWDSKKALAKRVAQYWLNPETPRRVLSQLSREEALAFAYAVRSSPFINHQQWARDLTNTYGGRDKEWTRVIERLLLLGLVFRSERSPYGFGHGNWYFLPEPLCILLAPILPQCPAVQKLPPRPSDAPVTRAPSLSLSHGAALLCAVRHSGVRVNQNRTLNQTDLKRMTKVLPKDLPLPLEEAVQMFAAAGCLQTDKETRRLNLVPAQIAAFLGSEAALRALRLSLLIGTSNPLASLLLAVMWATPPGGWAPLDAVEVGRAWANYIERQITQSEPSWSRGRYSGFHQRLDQLVEAAARHSFFEALRDARGQVLALRLSPDFLLLATPAPTAAAPSGRPAGKLHVQPNLDVIAPPDVPGTVLSKLINFVELKQMDVVVTYRLAETACRRAAQDGLSADAILDLLQANSTYGVPDNVAHTVRGWMRNAGAVRFVQGLLLQCLQPQAAAELKSNPSLRRWILQELTPQIFVIDGVAYKKVREALEQRGYIPPRHIARFPLEGRTPARPPWYSDYEEEESLATPKPPAPGDFGFAQLSQIMQQVLADAQSLWNGTPRLQLEPTAPAPKTRTPGRTRVSDLISRLMGDSGDELDEEEIVADPNAGRSPAPPRVAEPAAPESAPVPKPALDELTPLPEEALADSLNEAINFGMSAFIGYRMAGRREPSIFHISPHWMETRPDQTRTVWAFCHDMNREHCFLLSQISGILLRDAKT